MTKERTIKMVQPLATRQPLKAAWNMRSPYGLLAALVLLSAIPIALLCQIVLGVDLETSIHFLLATSSGLMALAVFDFKLPAWVTWLGSLSASIAAAIFLLQGVSQLIPNDVLFYFAYRVLGGPLEAALIDALMLWFVALVLGDSQGKTRLFGAAAVSIVVCCELYKYSLAYLSAEPVELLKLSILLPFVWLLLESRKKPVFTE